MIYEWFFTQDQNIERVLLPTVHTLLSQMLQEMGICGCAVNTSPFRCSRHLPFVDTSIPCWLTTTYSGGFPPWGWDPLSGMEDSGRSEIPCNEMVDKKKEVWCTEQSTTSARNIILIVATPTDCLC